MLGTSSAALIGLLFVVTSIRIEDLAHNSAFKTRARNVTFHLLAMLVQSIAVLTPQAVNSLGMEVIVINLCGLMLPATLLYQALYKNKALGKRGDISFYRGGIYVGGYVLGLLGGAALIAKSNLGLRLITISYVVFLVSVIWDAWKIMFGVEQAQEAQAAGKT
jgi:hypothetical protein